jgi:hypothetical protein
MLLELLFNVLIGSLAGGLIGYVYSYRNRGEPGLSHTGLNQLVMISTSFIGGGMIGFWYWVFRTLGSLI